MRAFSFAPKSQEQANFFHLVMDIAWFGLALPATSRFLQVYAIRLGANANDLGWMTSLPAVIMLASASLGSWWMSRYRDSQRALLWPALTFRLVFFLPALTPFMPPSFQVTWLILSLVLPALPQGLSAVAFLVLMRESVGERQITLLTSRRFLAMNVTLSLSGLALGFWLEKAPFPLNYQIMFILAFIFAGISLWHVMKIHLLAVPTQRPASGRVKVNPWRVPAFQQVAFITALIHVAFFSVSSLIQLHLVQNLKASESFLGVYALAEVTAAASITLFVPRMAARMGNRWVIASSMVTMGIGTAMVALAPNAYFALPAGVVMGASWTAATISLFSYFSESTPGEGKSYYTTGYMQVVSLTQIVGPLVGSALYQSGADLIAILLVGASLRVMAGVFTQLHALEWMGRKLRVATFTR